MASLLQNVVGENLPDDAADYVDSILSSQQPTRVCTPLHNGRKRNRSAPSPALSESLFKRARSSRSSLQDLTTPPTQQSSVSASTRRSLYPDVPTPTPAPRKRTSPVTVDPSAGAPIEIETLINKLSTDVRSMFSELTNRIDRLEQGLEQRISSKVAQILDKRINTEMNRVRKDVDSHIERVTDSIKAEVAADIADINQKVAAISNSGAHASPEIACNVVIRNLPETSNENTKDKVNVLFSEGCGLHNVSAVSAERKKGTQGKPGVVIAKLASTSDKKAVMLNKRKLKNSRRFSEVFVHHDQSKADRLIADNFRAILAAVKSCDHNLSLRGARVVRTGGPADSRDFQQPRNQNSQQPRNQNSQQHSSRRSEDAREGNQSRSAWNRNGNRGRNHNRRY